MNSSHPTVTPGLLYHDAMKAIEWLNRAFGFEVRLVIPDSKAGRILHAHLIYGNGGVMLSSAEEYAFPNLCRTPRQIGGVGTVEIVVRVEEQEMESHYERARKAGAEILVPLESKPYGGRGYSCRDIEGHDWAFGSYEPWAGNPQPL